MATITSIGTGKWSAAGTWDAGVPADGDAVVIATGHVVTFDVDQSAWVTGIAGLTITGTLNFETAAGTYYLMMKAATTINGAGTMNVGTEAVPIPFVAKHTITGGAGWYINGAGGLTMTVYAAEPTYQYIRLSAAEAAGQTVLSVDTDVTGDIWADGDTIHINNIDKGRNSEERTIAIGGIAADEITVTAGLTGAKLEGTLVILMSRNVKLIGNGTGVDTSYVCKNFTKSSLIIGGGQWTSPYRIFTNNMTIFGGSFSGKSTALYRPTDSNISDGVFSDCTLTMQQPENVIISGGLFSGATGHLYFPVSTTIIGGLFSGADYCISDGRGVTIMGGEYCYSVDGIVDTVNLIFYGGEIYGNTRGIYNSVSNINSVSLHDNVNDVRQMKFVAYNTLFGSATEVALYTNSTKEIYSESIDHDQVQGAYKAWTKGGVTTLQSTVYPTGYTESYNIILENADNEGYFQKELVISAGQSVNFDLYLRKDGAMTYLPRFQIFLKRVTDPFAGGTPEHTFTMTNSVDTWESDTYTYSNDGTEDETLVIRCLGKAASGNVYGMYDAEILNVDLTESLSRLAAIKAITDQFNFTVANQVDANALTGGASPIEIRTEMDANSTKLASILEDTGTTLPAVLNAIKGTGWTDEDLVAIKAAVDSVKTWTAANISASVTSGKITQIRGDTWNFNIPDLTLDGNLIQLAIKETKLDADAQALLLIDTTTGLLYVNGAAASDATKASLSYVGTTLTVTVDASITAQLPTAGNYHYGIQSVTAAGVVSESYGGTFTITADTVRATA